MARPSTSMSTKQRLLYGSVGLIAVVGGLIAFAYFGHLATQAVAPDEVQVVWPEAQESPTPPTPQAPTFPGREDGLFLVADPLSDEGPAPERYAGALPSEDLDPWPESSPPRWWFKKSLCMGDPDLRERWLTAVRAAGDDEEQLAWKGGLLQGCWEESHLAWVAEMVEAGGPIGFAAGRYEYGVLPPSLPEGPRPEASIALEARLKEVGLIGPDVDCSACRGTDHRTLLVEAGLAVPFWIDPGHYPIAHEWVLIRMAALAGPPMDGVIWAEVPAPITDENVLEVPSSLDGEGTIVLRFGGGYVLRAWAEGRRWELIGQPVYDDYDVDAIVGLFNRVARDLGVQTRAFELRPVNAHRVVLVADPEPIRRALEARVIQTLRPGSKLPEGFRDGPEWELIKTLRGLHGP